MTPEERLRQLLQDEAELLVPSADALPLLRRRVAERRSWGRRLRPLLAVATATAVVVLGTVGTTALDRSADPEAPPARERVDPVETDEPDGCTAGGDVLCAEDDPLPAVPVTSGVTTSGPGVPFWPFVDDREAASWVGDPGTRRWAADPQQVAQHLVDDLLALPDLVAGPVAGTEVPLTRDDLLVGTVRLVQVGKGRGMPWSVVSVTASDLEVSEPALGERVDSPLVVETAAGAATVRLLSSSGRVLATAGAGSAALDWRDLTWSVGAVVATLGDPLQALAVVPVRRSGAAGPGIPPAATTFVAVDRGSVVLHDARSGQRLRQLSYPPEGATDSDPTRGGDGAVFVRQRADRCADELVRVSLGSGAAGVTVPRGGRSLRSPALSPDGRLLVWVDQGCRGDAEQRRSAEELVMRGADARERRLPLVTERTDLSGIDQLAVRDDGALLFRLPDGRPATLAAGATTVDASSRVDAGSTCPDAAPAWSGRDVWLWRGCPGSLVGLLLAAPDYGSGLQSPTEPVTSVRVSSVAQSSTGPRVLAQLGTDASPGPVVRLVDGRLVEVYANSGCGTPGASCVTDPTW